MPDKHSQMPKGGGGGNSWAKAHAKRRQKASIENMVRQVKYLNEKRRKEAQKPKHPKVFPPFGKPRKRK
tara:strand:+ start:68 stop:274 length:207 start_codon:yes stop_codon:yes gene_type:complete